MIYSLQSSNVNTKSRIIEILSKTWPLSTKQVFDSLKKQYGVSVTYQAIHLSIRELIEQSILLKDDKKYMLSPSWVERTAADFNRLVESYTRNNRITEAKEFQELNFSSPGEAWQFLLEKANSDFFGKSDVCYIQVARLFAVPLSNSHVDVIREFAQKTKVILMCRRDGPIERICANFLRKLGVEVRLVIPCAQPNNIVLIGNSVIDIYVLYPGASKVFESFYNSVKDVLKQDIFTMFASFMSGNIKVKLSINRNKEVYANILELTKKSLS